MSRRRYYLFVPGIFQHPAGHDDWPDFACDWVRDHAAGEAGEYEYKCGIFKTPGQPRRVEDCRTLLEAHADYDRVLVGHSNGCDIICKLLDWTPRLNVKAVHLVAAATPAHCGNNGLNGAARRGQVEDVHLYVSANDRALWAGGVSWNLFHWFGRGFGDLGRSGPANVGPELDRILQITQRDELDHSDWLWGENFQMLMRNVTR